MILFQWLVFTFLFLVGCFFFYFAVTSRQEKEKRAAALALVVALLFVILSFAVLFYTPILFDVILFYFILLSLGILLLPFSPASPIKFVGDIHKVDERDIMFARARYKKNSREYQDYYQRHPERQKVDDELRAMPDLCDVNMPSYNPIEARQTDSYFQLCEKMAPLVDGKVADRQMHIYPDDMNRKITQMAKSFGAVDVKFSDLDQSFVYSHVGRGMGEYGEPIVLNHPHVIVFAVEMDYLAMQQAPNIPVITESARNYYLAAHISIAIAEYIRSLGYQARAHIDANYRIMLPAVAAHAGLGQVGRLGYLIHPIYGARIRLGAVTTDMPVKFDRRKNFGVHEFCRVCKKCAKNCPSAAISFASNKAINGVVKWQTNQQACYKQWRTVGTDCGICMRVCPFSKTNSLPHKLIRFAIQHNPVARRFAVWGDGLFYGRGL